MHAQQTWGPFWIDAVCIDQICTSERNHQVSVMGRIYSQAREGVAWLGHESAMTTPSDNAPVVEPLSRRPVCDVLQDSQNSLGLFLVASFRSLSTEDAGKVIRSALALLQVLFESTY